MLNKVTLIGHVGKEPEIRSFQNGGKVAQQEASVLLESPL
jgi:single-stranded DNA-binding protein